MTRTRPPAAPSDRGTLCLRPESITSICTLRDCHDLLEAEDRFQNED